MPIPPWLIVWLLAAAVVGLFWCVRHVMVADAVRHRVLVGSGSHPAPLVDPPMISVIVAAKDEQDNIEACVTTLLDQDYPDYEIIVVDDRSEDRTGAILSKLVASAAGRLKVVTVRTLRDGWFGKNNAMREGVAASRGEWLLFTDADCRQTSRRTLSVGIAEALTHDADFLSITPILETPTLWERIIQPVCALTLIVHFVPNRVNNPASPTAYANGAFMLIRRQCYDAIGGHERVRTEVNEDVRMARFAKREGFGLRVAENEDLYVTRMYATPTAAWHGWSRIFYGCLGSVRSLATSAAMLVGFSVVPWACLIVALVGLAGADAGEAGPWRWSVGAWAGVIVIKQLVLWGVYRVVRVAPIASLGYIVGVLVTLGMLVSAMFKVGGRSATTWRGTKYRGHCVDAEAAHLPVGSDVLKGPAPRV
ncbi:MAG: glycosyltransferase [Phycisphaerae bacterium]